MSAQSTGSGSPLVSGAPVACPWHVPLLFSPEKACNVPIPRLFDSCSFHGEWAKWLLVMACFLCSLLAEQCEWPTWTVIVGAPSGCFSLCSILQVDGGLTESGSYKVPTLQWPCNHSTPQFDWSDCHMGLWHCALGGWLYRPPTSFSPRCKHREATALESASHQVINEGTRG